MTFNVLLTDYAWPSLKIEREVLEAAGGHLIVAESDADSDLAELATTADAILTNWRRVPVEVLDMASRCLVVSRYGIGVDNIPVARATELGILVTNVPDFCLDEVSDHAMALILACARRLVTFNALTRKGSWNLDAAAGMSRLRGQTLGLIGFGNVARAVVPKARAFGLDVLAYSPRLEPGRREGLETTNDLQQVLAASDYVSLHAPANAETIGLIGAPELAAMKPGAYLINTSRGALIDEEALARVVREGRIAGAALDVLAHEPAPADHPLLGLDGVIITPHVAFYSEAAIRDVESRAAS